MKKYLISLLALMAILPALADSYFTLTSVVNDTLWIKYSSVGFYQMDTLCANFDGRLDNWDLEFDFPVGFSLNEVRKEVDMTSIPFLNLYGNNQILDAPLYSNSLYNIGYGYFYIDSISSTITTFGYWDPYNSGTYESYGTVKWEAGYHNKMALLIIKVNSDVHCGDKGLLTISGMMSSTSDSRGGTISETTFTKTIRILAGYRRGDVNGDGEVNVADVSELNDYILNHSGLDEFQLEAADVDGNGIIDISDLSALIDLIVSLGTNEAEDPTL